MHAAVVAKPLIPDILRYKICQLKIALAAESDPKKMTHGFTIRPATPADIPDMLAFIRELAEYEREPASALATADDLLRDGFPEPGSVTPARFHALIAEWSETPEDKTAAATPQSAGFALYFYNYST